MQIRVWAVRSGGFHGTEIQVWRQGALRPPEMSHSTVQMADGGTQSAPAVWLQRVLRPQRPRWVLRWVVVVVAASRAVALARLWCQQ